MRYNHSGKRELTISASFIKVKVVCNRFHTYAAMESGVSRDENYWGGGGGSTNFSKFVEQKKKFSIIGGSPPPPARDIPAWNVQASSEKKMSKEVQS